MTAENTDNKWLAVGGLAAGALGLGWALIRKKPSNGELAVTTLQALDVLSDSVTLNGKLDSLGDNEAVTVSFELGATAVYGEETEGLELTHLGSFSMTLDNLLPNTTYHYRAKAVGAETAYGADKQFTTLESGVVDYGSLTATYS